MFLASLLLAASAAVTPVEMKALYEEVKTPFKVGAVMRAEKGTMIDNPCVYRTDDGWRMMFIVYDGKGYETHLAKSDDLVHWTRLGLVLERGAAGSWDSAQADGGPALFSTEWGGDNRMRKYRDWYWMTYIGGAKTGYETAPLSISVATAKDNSTADKWLRMTAHPVLSPEDPDARAFEDYELFRSFVVQDPLRRLGKEFVMYYNAKRRSDRGESIGMAVSDDMLNWRRYGDGAVLTNGKPVPGERGIGLVGDPMLTKIGDTYVMFYFSAFYPTAQSPARDVRRVQGSGQLDEVDGRAACRPRDDVRQEPCAQAMGHQAQWRCLPLLLRGRQPGQGRCARHEPGDPWHRGERTMRRAFLFAVVAGALLSSSAAEHVRLSQTTALFLEPSNNVRGMKRVIL